jgi:hypothetical protein
MRFRATPPKDLKMTFANMHTEINGDKAVLRYRSTIRTE